MAATEKKFCVNRLRLLLLVAVCVFFTGIYAIAGTTTTKPDSTTKPADADKTLVCEKELVAELKDCPQTGPDRAKKLIELFKQAGLKDVKTQEFQVDDDDEEEPVDCRNIIATLPGKTDSIIVIGAHFDFVKKGKGVIDNWSGVTMMANIAQAMAAGEKSQHTFMFIGFDMEESGLLGSQFFLKELTAEQRKKIVAMVNVDSVGLSNLSVYANGSADDLEAFAAELARKHSVKLDLIRLRLAASDATSFMAAEIPSVCFVGLSFRDLGIIHSENDKFERIRPRRYVEQYGYMVKFVRALDAQKKEISVTDRESSLKPAKIGIAPDVGAAGEGGSFIVDGVAAGSVEEKAGMKIGDIIVCIPAEKIKTPELIAIYLLSLNEGDKVVYKVKRGEKILEIKVQY